MNSVRIFERLGVKLATSERHDGHMSFDKVADAETEANVNNFMDSLAWHETSRVYMGISYAKGRTFDEVKVLASGNLPPKKFAKSRAISTDALICSQSRVALMLPTADCYAVTLFDPQHRVLALCHVGWHSTAANLLLATTNRLQADYNSRPQDLLVHFGPGIGAKDYVFDEPAQLKMPGWKPYLRKTQNGWGIDLLGYNLNQLKQVGIKKQNIHLDPRNTVDSPELESNYVHNQHNLTPARRFLNVVMLT